MAVSLNTIINGTDLGVYLGGSPVLIALSTSCTITLNRDMRDTSNKDSSGWKAVLPGQKNWTVSCEGLYNPSSSNSYPALYTAWLNGTALTLTFKNSASGDYIYTGTAYITSLSQNAPNEGNVTWTVSFQGTAAIAQTS